MSSSAEGYLGIALFGAVIENSMLSNIEGPSDANVLGMFCIALEHLQLK